MKTNPAVRCQGLVGLLFVATQMSLAAQTPASASAKSEPSAPDAAKALEPFRVELLRTAFAAASAFPLEPHRKNRSRAQEEVVVACFELDQPDLAAAFARDIGDWRRGVAYADYAWNLAKRGDATGAAKYLDLAEQVAVEEGEDPNSQQWRTDLIAIKMARACRSLGDEDRAAKLLASVDATSANAVDANWASTEAERVDAIPLAKVADELAAVDATFATLSLGRQQATLTMLVRLHQRCFGDRELRAAIEQRVEKPPVRLPGGLHVEALGGLADNCLAQGDKPGSLRFATAMNEELDGLRLRTEERLPLAARIAGLRGRAGDTDGAKAELAKARALFEREHDEIIDIYRARALRPLAKVAHDLGDRETTEALLLQALAEGTANPNSRPRAFDLVATCVAMAKAGIEPSTAIRSRIREIAGGLGEPW